MSMTLENRLVAEHASNLNKILFLLFGAVTLAAASQLSIPLQPVPLTFQSSAVVLLGLCMGSKRALQATSLYLIAGAIGLPVLANFHGGLPYFFGPTGGYLLGFLPAAFLAGFLAEKGFAKHYLTAFMAALLSASVIFACGLSYLALQTNWTFAIMTGLKPFVITEIIKLAVVALIVPRCWNTPR